MDSRSSTSARERLTVEDVLQMVDDDEPMREGGADELEFGDAREDIELQGMMKWQS